MAHSDLPRRLAVAGIGVPIGIGVTYLGARPVALVAAAIAALGAHELFRIAGAKGDARPFAWLGIPAAALLVLWAAAAEDFSAWAEAGWIGLVSLTLGALALALFFRPSEDRPLAAVATTLLGVLYLGGTLSFAVHLRALPATGGGAAGWEGALVLIFPFAITWIGDAAAYFAGHRWGRRKLLPRVSPGKTIEGGVGGLAGSVLAAAAFAGLLFAPFTALDLPIAAAALLGLVVGSVAQVGDLVESLLKREAGVKDSGSLFPGHGGVLDRFDALLFTLPLTYLLLPLFLR